MKHFYHSIIEIDSLFIELDNLELSDAEKAHLAKLVDENLHHEVLDVIFEQLSDEDKKIFLQHLEKSHDDKIWQLLNDKAENIEEKIKAAAESVKKELHQDIKAASQLND